MRQNANVREQGGAKLFMNSRHLGIRRKGGNWLLNIPGRGHGPSDLISFLDSTGYGPNFSPLGPPSYGCHDLPECHRLVAKPLGHRGLEDT